MSSSGPPTSGEPELCAADCGFFGSSATMGFCSVCFKLFVLSQSPSQTPATTTTTINTNTATSDETDQEVSAPATAAVVVPANRCSQCRRKVGLLGFTCRCGGTFCGSHRYPEIHGCSFDFKAVGREDIAKSNPVVKPEKLDRL